MSATLTVEAWLADVLTDATLLELAPGGAHDADAPIATVFPHVVIDWLTSDDTNGLNGRSVTTVRFIARVVGKDVAAAELGPAVARLDALLTLAVATPAAGATVAGCRRTREERGSSLDQAHTYRWLGGEYKAVVHT